MKRISLLLVLIAALALVGCTRSASTPPPASGDAAAASPTVPFTTPDGSLPGEMGTLAAGGFATQTAQAAGAGAAPGDQGSLAVQETVTPEPTAASVEPTPEPTAEPAPTEVPAAASCTSPYTVQKDEWVWAIGRKCNIDPNAIIAANNLRYPYTLYPGDELILPTGAAPFTGP